MPTETAHAVSQPAKQAQAKAAENSPYLRGDGAASAYVGFVDPQGRTFRKWADKIALPFTLIGTVRTYRKSDIDRAWLKHAEGQI